MRLKSQGKDEKCDESKLTSLNDAQLSLFSDESQAFLAII